MATLKLGSKGNEVKQLQQQLNALGYDLAEDGIYGSKTQTAVRQFQRDNALDADGIVGQKTWAQLGASASAQSPADTPSPTVQQARTRLEQLQAAPQLPDADTHEAQIRALTEQILGSAPFTYDPQADPLYRQALEQADRLGQEAGAQSARQAQQLTGGYEGSYLGETGHALYLQLLDNIQTLLPQLYQLAYGRSLQEANDRMQALSLLRDDADRQYARVRDAQADRSADRASAADAYFTALEADNANRHNQQTAQQEMRQFEAAQARQAWENRLDADRLAWQKSLDSTGSAKTAKKSGGSVLDTYRSRLAAIVARTPKGQDPGEHIAVYLRNVDLTEQQRKKLAKEFDALDAYEQYLNRQTTSTGYMGYGGMPPRF